MTVEAPALKLHLPQTIAHDNQATELYMKAFNSVFEFILKSGKLTADNVEAVNNAYSNHSQNVFMAKMGIIEEEELKTSFEKLYTTMGFNKETDQQQISELQTNFKAAVDELGQHFNPDEIKQLYQTLVENCDAHFLGYFSQLDDATKEKTLPYMQKLVQALDTIKVVDLPELTIEQKIERNGRLAQAVITAVEKTKADIADIASIPGARYDIGSELKTNLEEILKAVGIEGISSKEKESIVAFIEKSFISKEKAEAETTKLQDFLKDYGKWLVMLFPVVAGPLAKVFSYIPILGKPLNMLLAQVHQQSGNILAAFAGSAMTGSGRFDSRNSSSDEKVERKQAPPAARKNESAEHTLDLAP